MRKCVLTVAAAVAFAATGMADDKNPFEGKWTIQKLVRDGKEDESMKGAVREHTGDKYIITPPKDSKAPAAEGTFTFDLKEKTIDMKPSTGTYKGKTLLGIFLLNGDEVTVVFAEKDRPKDFEGGAGKGHVLVKMKKAK
jgi:uncharacterized protein (TIGR03067 family)